MPKKQMRSALFMFLLLACNPVTTSPEQSSVETIVAGTLQALTVAPAQPSATNGIQFTDDNLSFVIPTGIATSVTEEVVQAVPPSEGAPWWGVYPEHREYNFDGYALTDVFHRVAIYLYPIEEYIAMNEDVDLGIETLKSLIANPNQPLPERLPFLPTFNAAQMFYSNFGTVTFQNGSGIRYVTEFSQFPHPIGNNGMFYTFQGITSDGQYYVSAIMPINIGFLVGYPTPTDQGDFEFIQSEVERVTQQLNNSKPEAFTPSMLTLDVMIQSISVTGIP